MLVLVPADVWRERLEELAQRADAAARRHRSALPGETAWAVSYSQLADDIERLAVRVSVERRRVDIDPANDDNGRHSWTRPGTKVPQSLAAVAEQLWAQQRDGVLVEVRDPLAIGPPVTRASAPIPAFPVAPVFRSRSRGVGAVQERLETQIANAELDPSRAVVPAASNSVLTPTLRDWVCAKEGKDPFSVQVSYQDGSAGDPFPLRSLPLTLDLPIGWREFRFTLLSIRHTAEDIELDGSFLLNSVISRVRQHGETDRLVSRLALEQLDELARQEPVILHIYQSGLQPAIVGFWRAVVLYLTNRGPGRLAVVPWIWRSSLNSSEKGQAWVL